MERRSISVLYPKHICGLFIKNKITKKKKPIDDIVEKHYKLKIPTTNFFLKFSIKDLCMILILNP